MQGMMRFSSPLEAALGSSGWSPSRRVGLERWADLLASEGFDFTPEARCILGNLGGLEIAPAGDEGRSFAPETTRFDPVTAASGEFDRIDHWQKHLGMKLSPLAEYGQETILLAEDGRVFGVWDDALRLWGGSFPTALENLVLATHTPVEFARMT